ncbi:thioredoxin domain-containing protein [Kineosporia sp. J2-2]|uniref:Thioredoxin domain-containing protein n=1 Tax=Kineosporia corallincola TaxID=2835133 RepID=A0ABS5TFX2_9ACTN|nr:thioredoxin domain-containing protein [Kineosporia corallincola]MBT0769091.1 thioredoxin domain-containing protein [Kineosporia corallincola]
MVSGKASREARREKIAEARLRVARQEATRKAVRVGSLVIVLVVAVMAGLVFWQEHDSGQEAAAATTATPANLGLDNSVVDGDDSAAVKVVIYEDFQCADCAAFESATRDQLADWVKDGDVQVQYRPVALLDDKSTDDYSTRALNALGAVVNADADAALEFQQLLLDNQPDEGGAGLTDDQLVDYAVQAGADEDIVRTAVEGRTYQDWTAQVTQDASTADVTTTPTVLVNGTALDDVTKKALKSAVTDALAVAAATDTTVSEK